MATEYQPNFSFAAVDTQLKAAQVLAIRINTLNRIVNEINGTDDLETVLLIVATQGQWLLDFDAVGIALSDDYGYITLRLLHPFDQALWSVLPGSDAAQQFVDSRTTTITNFNQARYAPLLSALGFGEKPLRSVLLVPLRAGTVFQGTLLLGSTSAAAYDTDDVHIAHLFGTQLSAAVQRTRLAFQLRNEHANLATLYQTLTDLASSTSVDDLLRRLIQIGVVNTGAERGTAVQIDPTNGQAVRVITWPLDTPDLTPTEVLQQGLFPRVMLNHKPLLVSNAPANPDWATTIAAERDTHSVLCVPLCHRQQLGGVLRLTHDEVNAFDEGHLAMIVTLAVQASVMLENVRMAEQQRHLFHQYVPTTVADQLLLNPDLASLGGMRHDVTILFADIANFTTFAESHTPEMLIAVLNTYLGIAADAVLESGGTLDKFMGDAVMAIFNAPLAQPDHVARAARAALRIQQLIAAYHQQVPAEQRLAFRVGLHTGEAVVGNIGTEALRNYTAVGDVVNTAKRIQEQAPLGAILVSSAVRQALGGAGRTERAALVSLKGKREAQPLYQLLDLHSP